MSQILPCLYVGSLFDAKNKKQLEKLGITHIVSVHDTARPLDDTRKYLCIEASDIPEQNLSDYFSKVNDFVHDGRQHGVVLIHCLAGISRSVTLASAYIMTVTNLSWRPAINVVQGSRRMANPNLGFKKQLRIFEAEHLSKERERFRIKYPRELDRHYNDTLDCQRSLASYQRWVQFGDQLREDNETWLVEKLTNQCSKKGDQEQKI